MAASIGLIASAICQPIDAGAAEVTDVLDSFDFERDNPFDLSLRVRFGNEQRSAFIAREWRCLKGDQIGAQKCPDGSAVLLNRELEYERTRRTIFIDARFGLYKDVEFAATFPFVLLDQREHSFAANMGRTNSSLYPESPLLATVGVPFRGAERSGLGDMHLTLRWAPYNYYRERAHPSWVLGFDYGIPSGEVMTASNTGVGYGLHEIKLFTTISRRALRIVEPYFEAHGVLRTGAGDSLFKSQGQTQTRVNPGPVIGTRFGTEIIPWEDIGADTRVELDFGFGMEYTFQGREYSEIWEALASNANPCRPEDGCSNTSYSKSDVDPSTKQHRRTDGITEVEPYGRFEGWAGLYYQPLKHFQIGGSFTYGVESPHFITFGGYGKDLDNQGGVQASNSKGENEYSPVYLPALDTPGRRLRVQDVGNWGFMLSVAGKI